MLFPSLLSSVLPFLAQEPARLATFTWPVTSRQPPAAPRALVFFSHGYAEHLKPYFDGLGRACGAHGLLCWGHDHQGFGASGGARAEAASMEDYTRPLVTACRRARSQHPGVPLFLLGNSMGGLVALAATLDTPGRFDGLVLLVPLIDNGRDNAFNRVLGLVAGKVCPGCSPSPSWMDYLGVQVANITESKAWQEVIRRDPLYYHGGLKFGQAQAGLEAIDRVTADMEKVKVPLLVLHGGEDTVTLVRGSRELVRRAGTADKQLIEVPGARHSLILDQLPRVEGTIMGWLLHRSN